MALLKSGWLWRQSSILRRWKKCWFDLWMDGGLVYYPDENRQNIEERILLKFHCMNIKSGLECGDIQPPDGCIREALLTMDMRDHSRLMLCAESADDAVAWKMAIVDAKAYPVYVYDPYDDQYQSVPMNAHHAVYVTPPYGGCGYAPGLTHILFREDRSNHHYGEQLALGMLAGAAAGSALGSLMWLPCWF
ncbi:pleckstrin homology domain-containing family B member 1 [Pelodytes ibericus]